MQPKFLDLSCKSIPVKPNWKSTIINDVCIAKYPHLFKLQAGKAFCEFHWLHEADVSQSQVQIIIKTNVIWTIVWRNRNKGLND